MIESYLDLRPVFARHETFQPRYGWLYKAANAVTADAAIMAKNTTSQFDLVWLTFHQTMVNSTAQRNSTMSRQLPS